jgi:putative ABC transport system substrate-binding protein
MFDMRRREFTMLLGSATVARPLVAGAQPTEGVRRIGFVSALADDAITRARVKALLQGLRDLGWTEGRNLRIDYRFAAGDPNRIKADVAELVGLAPDVIVAQNSPVVSVLKKATSSIPIVVVSVADMVEQGFVASLAHPGGNITGFTAYEPAMIGKMLETLKEMAPGLVRAQVMFNPETGAFISAYLRSAEVAGASFGITVTPASIRTVAEIEEAIAELGRKPGSGLIVPAEAFTIVHRGLIIRLAEQHRVPAIYSYRSFVAEGGLMSYGADQYDIFRRSASYVDRILKGARPADLPVQQPTKFELAINLKTARALGLSVPLSMQQLADEVIE